MQDILAKFFTRNYENMINTKLIYYSFKLPKDDLMEYINDLVYIPVSKYIEYIRCSKISYKLKAKDVFQFSSLDNATINLCKVIIKAGDKGIKHFEAGKLLQNDNITRNVSANTKYGENHLKTAETLGLVFSILKTYYLSCLGYVYNKLSVKKKNMLLVRLLLRCRLFYFLINCSNNGEIDLRSILEELSDTTYNRRKTNIKFLINLLLESDEYDFNDIFDKIAV